jgi:hypothetical protein
VLGGEATNTNFIVFGFTRLGLEHTIYYTRREHANHYTTNAVNISIKTPQRYTKNMKDIYTLRLSN